MNPIADYAKQLDRARREYRTQQERVSEDFITKVKDTVSDILDYLNFYYPFKGDYFCKLKQTVFYQLDVILCRRRDLSHQAIADICRSGNIDWFAEPFFGARKLKLSKLLEEYDAFRYERTGPSSDCYAYFQINRDDSHIKNDSQSDRSDGNGEEEEDRIDDRAGDGDFKRQRTGQD